MHTVCVLFTEVWFTHRLRWSIQKGYITLPKSVVPQRQRENIDVFNFTLSEDVMAELDALECDFVTGWDPIRDHEV